MGMLVGSSERPPGVVPVQVGEDDLGDRRRVDLLVHGLVKLEREEAHRRSPVVEAAASAQAPGCRPVSIRIRSASVSTT